MEADWSGASYWYQIAAMSESANVELEHLTLNSLQGDSVLAKWFEIFGIHSVQKSGGVTLKKIKVDLPQKLKLDFIENPDLAQTMAVLCVAKKLPFHFTGLKTLKIKETDRVAALINEFGKVGANLVEPQLGELAWDGVMDESRFISTVEIETYHDHRMALAFAPLAMVKENLVINDPLVVTKSYPKYWEHLKSVGFEINQG